MPQTIPEELVKEVRERARKEGGIVALARSLGVNKGLVSMAYHGEYLAPVLRVAMGFPNRKPIQTCACGEVHTVPWCTKKKGAAIPENEKEIVYVEVKPEPKTKRQPRTRHRVSLECDTAQDAAALRRIFDAHGTRRRVARALVEGRIRLVEVNDE